MGLLKLLFPCLPVSDSKTAKVNQKIKTTSTEIVNTLFSAEKPGEQLKHCLEKIVDDSGLRATGGNWKQELARAILEKLIAEFQAGISMGVAMYEAYEKAETAAVDFVCEHPILVALIALAVLALLMPWALEWAGFAFDGPIANSYAALWQSAYLGRVPKRSWFSFFQRLGMTKPW